MVEKERAYADKGLPKTESQQENLEFGVMKMSHLLSNCLRCIIQNRTLILLMP